MISEFLFFFLFPDYLEEGPAEEPEGPALVDSMSDKMNEADPQEGASPHGLGIIEGMLIIRGNAGTLGAPFNYYFRPVPAN